MSKKSKQTEAVTAALTEIIDGITTKLGGDGVATIAIGLALYVRGRLSGSGEDDLSDDDSAFSDRLAVGITAAKTIRAEATEGDDDTGFDGHLPTDWESAKTAFDSIITGVNWGG